MTTTAIEARAVTKRFGAGEITALDAVSISIAQGEFFTLLGPSGCGKTTLLRCIAGFETPTDGAILLSGSDITASPPNKRNVNTVFQSYALFPHLTVAQNIGFGLKMRGDDAAKVDKRTEEMLALVKMEQMASRRPEQLSGGQQQRVALARALAPAPEVLLLDEPLSALDLKLRKEMQSELKRLQSETGITFVFVTHDQEEALTMSDRIAVMSHGQLQQVGSPREIYTRPVNRFVADFIGETNFLEAEAKGDSVTLSTGDTLPLPGAGTGPITLAVRPELLRLTEPGEGDLTATVRDSVYFGTDWHCHLLLSDGTEVVARMQSPPTGESGIGKGQPVGLAFAPGALRVLED
ncbi:ABC transporter ATP-binding protein [Pseudoroseicyclus tamaricis]|uniref:Spermidine/putrescine import ATP-binding protein PotA n=1 Tax=Pseudoroseicyclus tamaricis TaxID=2705421 RepID=A0A6B2JW09_9RHOB|nr:ABC transporter ATP-binding protein [Pseudoroseicyclus tamaricis]NDV00404.1 ABC transporter ATP-binding protein [Pseudoroseicyclus tamaricis]